MNLAPAAMARSAWSIVRTVPAPSSISGTSLLIILMQSSAQAVRKVTSAAGSPPSTSALHRGTASSTLLKAITGMMPMSETRLRISFIEVIPPVYQCVRVQLICLFWLPLYNLHTRMQSLE